MATKRSSGKATKAAKAAAKRPVKAKAKAKPVKAVAKAKLVKAAAKAKPMKAVAKAKPVKAAMKATPVKAAAKAMPVATGTAGAPLGEGDRVPAFELADEAGALVSSADLAGKPYVLYFYPKDDTPGCTREACGFRDDLGAFEAAGVRVMGVSPDGSASHAKFRDKYGLPFTLLADTSKELAQAIGVWVKKQNYGREYMGIERTTFLVDADGKIRRVWRRVKVDGHVSKVLEAASA
jgi:peroxiredoxin Q/BCP